MEPFLKPMLCGSAQAPPTTAAWIMEPKLDGWRAITHVRDEDGLAVCDLFARSGASYGGKLPYVEEELVANLPLDTALDGELIGKGWGDVQGVMTRGTVQHSHVPSDAIPALTYVVFDLTRLNGTDLRGMTWEERRSLLEQIEWDEHVVLNPYDASTQEAHERFMALGYEGTVSKRKASHYSSGRAQSWVKVKPQSTAEAKVTGFKPGEGEFSGLVGALEFEMLGTGARSRCSGFDMDTRREITANPDRWLDTVIEIRHHGIGKTGKPRHPQFFRRRDDHEGETPRQAQVRRAMAAEKASRQGEKEPAMPRMRNYAAMGNDKLLRSYGELRAGEGAEAYDRCMNGGTGEPLRDIAVVEKLLDERGLR